MAILRPYQRIIGMGMPVVPLILQELAREPDQWLGKGTEWPCLKWIFVNPNGVAEHSPGSRVRERTLGNKVTVNTNPNGVTKDRRRSIR
jgi:hypothetical protein